MGTIVQEIRQETKYEIARQLLNYLDVITISESTGLSINEIQLLADEEKKLRVLRMSNNQRNLQKNLANIARIFGDDFYDHIVRTEPKLAKSINYAIGLTDGADMIERKIALRLLDDFSFEQVSRIMDIPVAKLIDMAHDHAANSPIYIDLPF